MIIRDKYLGKVKNWIDKPVIKVITGVRRSGKSYLLQMIQNLLLDKGISSTKIVYINYELIEYEAIRTKNKLNDYIHKKTDGVEGKCYIFIDEIQNCEDWEIVTASLLAEGRYDLYITGSNASMLSGDLATHIAGRYIEVQIYPLSFSEYCKFSDKLNWPNKTNDERFNQYIKYGGFPGLSNTVDEDEAKIQYLNGIRDTVVLRDVVQRHQIRDVVQLEKVLMYVFDNIGQIFSAKKVADYLKSIGYAITPDSVSRYIDVLEDAKVIYSAPRFDIKGKKIMQRLDKHYICDLGLRYADIGYRDNDISQILENIVYSELLSRGFKVYVGKEGNREVDFIAEKGDERHYYQVCYYLSTEKVIDREYRSLFNIEDSYPKTVLSMDKIPISIKKGVKHKNIIDFLLE